MSNIKKYFPSLSDFSLFCIKGGTAVSFAAALCSLLLYAAFTYYRFDGINMYRCALELRSYSLICLVESIVLALTLNIIICRSHPDKK